HHALGMPIDEYSRAPGAGGVGMLPIPKAGVLREVGGSEAALEIPGIEGLEITIPVGQKVVPLPEGNRYLGFLFARATTPKQVEAALRAAYASLDVKVEPNRP
ncbi:MAG: phosphoribosylglycinamide synthetase, partial [Thermoanaerobaculia bacterium]